MVLLQHQEKLDKGGHFSVRPDIVWRLSGRVSAVADIKYKLPSSNDIASADVYQALAYATRYGLDRCTLIYAEKSDISEVVVEGVTVSFAFIDLSVSDDELDRSIAEICEAATIQSSMM